MKRYILLLLQTCELLSFADYWSVGDGDALSVATQVYEKLFLQDSAAQASASSAVLGLAPSCSPPARPCSLGKMGG
jgi:hypothetical protein